MMGAMAFATSGAETALAFTALMAEREVCAVFKWPTRLEMSGAIEFAFANPLSTSASKYDTI